MVIAAHRPAHCGGRHPCRRGYDIALCTLAFAAILLPSSATCPSFTSPAAWHNLSTWMNRSLKAFKWRRRNSAIVRESGWFIAVRHEIHPLLASLPRCGRNWI
jgi:hypothetical protein